MITSVVGGFNVVTDLCFFMGKIHREVNAKAARSQLVKLSFTGLCFQCNILMGFIAIMSLHTHQVWRWHPERETSTPQRSSPPPRPPPAATVGWAEPPHRTYSQGSPAAMAQFLGRTTGAWWDSLALQRKSEGVRRSKQRMVLPFWWYPFQSSAQWAPPFSNKTWSVHLWGPPEILLITKQKNKTIQLNYIFFNWNKSL